MFAFHHRGGVGLLLLTLLYCSSSAIELLPQITIRAGVLHAPPFASVTEVDGGNFEYGGLQIDLLKRLEIFAEQDGVKLEFDKHPSPVSYDEAFDLVADDCETKLYVEGGINKYSVEDCNRFDLIVADYFANGPRSYRAELSPSWLKSTISTMKLTTKSEDAIDVTTMGQAVSKNAPVCLVDGTYYSTILMNRFPTANYLDCVDQQDCLTKLRQEECVLYADDELQLRHRAANDPDGILQVTPESFNTQYLVWASRFGMAGSPQLRKWIYDAVANATMDELFFKYFQKELCPVGSAGESCELPCDPDHGEADAFGRCVCVSTKWTGDDCSIEVQVETNSVNDSFVILAWTLLGINCFIIVAFGTWMFWQRKSAQVKMSQPSFLCMILLGCLISSSTIAAMIPHNDATDEDAYCMAVPWLYSVGFSITFGSLFAKIRRVYLIFKSTAESRPYKVSFLETAMVTGVVLLLDVCVLLAWTFVDPLTWQLTVLRTDKFGEPLEIESHCTSEHWALWVGILIIFHVALMGIACYMCYVSRNIPTKFSESKYVSIAMFSNLQLFAIAVPILIILGSDPVASFFIRVVVIWMNDFVVVTLIFGNLIYQVHYVSQKANDEKEYDHFAQMSHLSHVDSGAEVLDYTAEENESERNHTNSRSAAGLHSPDVIYEQDSEDDSEEELPPIASSRESPSI